MTSNETTGDHPARAYADGQVIEYTSFDQSGYSVGQVVRYGQGHAEQGPDPMVYIRSKSGGRPFAVRESQLRTHGRTARQ